MPARMIIEGNPVLIVVQTGARRSTDEILAAFKAESRL